MASLTIGGGYKKVRMGSLYLNGVAASTLYEETTPCYTNQSFINIGDTIKGNELTWIMIEDMNKYVADRVILRGVSWVELEKLGLTTSRYTVIDGKLFVCHLLEHNTDDFTDEWDYVVGLTGDSDDLWHWCGEKFWVDNPGSQWTQKATLIGGEAPFLHQPYPMDFKNENVGYRPVLELASAWVLFRGADVCLEGQSFAVYAMKSDMDTGSGEIPFMLVPQEKGRKTDKYVFSPVLINAQVPEKVQMYTFLVNGEPVPVQSTPIQYSPGMTVGFTDQFFGAEYLVNWRVEDGILFMEGSGLKDVYPANLMELGFKQPFPA